jgi:hypothetical protein
MTGYPEVALDSVVKMIIQDAEGRRSPRDAAVFTDRLGNHPN